MADNSQVEESKQKSNINNVNSEIWSAVKDDF